MKLTRKSFLKSAGITAFGLVTSVKLKGATKGSELTPPVCDLVPAETLGPFPSLPSGDAMYWRDDLTDGQAGVQLNFTIRVNGDNNCGVLQGYRVDVWHCNAAGYYSHYNSGGTNNGHGNANPPSTPPANNSTLIYGRGTQVTDANGEVHFTTIFPGWYPGRTVHIHFAIYAGGTVGSPNGWVQQRVSQFTFPIIEKNALLTSQAPYSNWGADPQDPNSDNVFSSPSGAWATLQLGTLDGVGSGPYSSYYELAIDATGVLPLDLLGFEGSAYGNGALLRWKTASEVNFSHFELEFSESHDPEDFVFLDRIESSGNNQYTLNDYVYEDTDRLIYGNAFYRLKMVDLDGTYKYSAIVSVRVNAERPLKVFPSPAEDHIILYHPQTKGGEKLLILEVSGKPVAVGELTSGTTFTRVNFDLCQSGIHYLIFANGDNNQTLKFVKL